MSVEDMRAQIRETSTDHDARLLGHLGSAVDVLETATNNFFVSQTWDVFYQDWPEGVRIPIGPVLSVASVNYTDEDGTEAALASTVWGSFVNVRPPFSACLFLKPNQSWPTTTLYSVYPIRVRMTVGWAQEFAADAAESGTDSQRIVMTAHGLITGDVIYNSTRNKQRTVTRLDDDTVEVEAIPGQTTSDVIRKFETSAIPKTFQQGIKQLVGQFFELTDDQVITPAGSALQALPGGATAERLAKRFALTQIS